MSHLVERLVELRRHLDHLREIHPRVTGVEVLQRDLSLHNDVLFSLLTICQLVIDISGELSSRNNQRFGDYTESVRNLAARPEFSAELVRELSRLPGFRNVLIHEYVALDFDQVVAALGRLDAIEEFAEVVRRIETST